MAHVVTLNALRRTLEAERLLQLHERGLGLPAIGEPAHALLLQRVCRVTRRELREMPLPPALRDEDAHRTAPSLAEEGLELFGLGQRDRRDDLGRQRAGGAVVQAEERRDDVRRRCALRSFEREVIAADDRAVAHAEDLHDGVTFIDRGGEHVEIVALVRVHLLAIEGAIDRDEAVAKQRRALELERLGGRRHLLARVASEGLVTALEEEHAAIDRRAVLVLRGVADARRGAALEMKEEARASAG